MRVIRNLWISEKAKQIVNQDVFREHIYISSINGEISIEGTDCDKEQDLNSRTFATTNSPIYLSIPNIKKEKIRVNSNNGRIYIKNLEAKELDIETDSGNIVLENVIANKLDVKKKNGNVVLNNIVADILVMETINGIAEFENVIFNKGNIGTRNNGSIFLKNVGASESLKVETNTGKVNGRNVAAKFGIITTECGKVELSKAAFDDIIIHSCTGKIDAEINSNCNSRDIRSEIGKVKVKSF